MLALSGLCEGFAREVVCLDPSLFPAPNALAAKSNHSRTYERPSPKSNYSRTYTKQRGGGWGHLTRDVNPEPAAGFLSYSYPSIPAVRFAPTPLPSTRRFPKLLSIPHMQTPTASPFPTSLTKKQGGRAAGHTNSDSGVAGLKTGHYRRKRSGTLATRHSSLATSPFTAPRSSSRSQTSVAASPAAQALPGTQASGGTGIFGRWRRGPARSPAARSLARCTGAVHRQMGSRRPGAGAAPGRRATAPAGSARPARKSAGRDASPTARPAAWCAAEFRTRRASPVPR